MNGAPATPADNYVVKGGGKYTGPQDPEQLRFEHRNDWRPSGNGNSPKIDEPAGKRRSTRSSSATFAWPSAAPS